MESRKGRAVEDGEIAPIGLGLVSFAIGSNSVELHCREFVELRPTGLLRVNGHNLSIVLNITFRLGSHSLCNLLSAAVDTPPVLDVFLAWVRIAGMEIKLIENKFSKSLIEEACAAKKKS